MEIETQAFSPKGWVKGGLIGSGSFGTVCLAINKSDGQLFAVKTVKGSDNIAYLEKEYEILRSLDSPYILRCLGKEYSVENGEEVCNLFMEYMPGGNVAELVAKFGGRLDESGIRAYTREILGGLEYIHGKGIIHCDLKGKNVLVGNGVLKLGDFGSAKRTEDKGFQLRVTPLWMAPEVVNQEEQGPHSDIWSLGCIIVEMATGRPPWSYVSNPFVAMYKIGSTDELPQSPRCLSSQGRDFLDKCFRKDPEQRWTASQLLRHPFVTEDVWSDPEGKRCFLSPTSALDIGHSLWESSSSGLTEKRDHSKVKFSALHRVAALATGSRIPDWSDSPVAGEWIIVRSSKGNLGSESLVEEEQHECETVTVAVINKAKEMYTICHDKYSAMHTEAEGVIYCPSVTGGERIYDRYCGCKQLVLMESVMKKELLLDGDADANACKNISLAIETDSMVEDKHNVKK